MILRESIPIKLLPRLDIIRRVGVAIAIGSAIYTAYSYGYMRAEEVAFELYNKVWASNKDFSHATNGIHVVITLCAVIGVLGLWTKKSVGVIVSGVAYLGMVMTYLWWYKISKDFLRGVELPYFTTEIVHIGPFMDATWWDITVLIVSACLFIWLLMILLEIKYKRIDH